MNELIDLEISEISLVDVGANQHADILFYKKKEEEMTLEELQARVETLAGKLDEVLAALKPAEEVVEEKKVEEVVDKRFVDLEKRNNELEIVLKAFQEKEIIAKFDNAASEFPNLTIEKSDLAKVLRAIDGIEEKDCVIKMLRSLDAQLSTSDITKSVGASGSVTDIDTTKQLDTIAKEIAANEKISYAKAYTKALTQHPELYK